MKKLYTVFVLLFAFSFSAIAQNEFYNDGADVTVEDGAEVYVKGEVVNQSGKIINDGLIELTGDFTDNATHDWSASGQRVVRFKGTAEQTASGSNLEFFNLEVDNPRQFTAGAWTGGVTFNNNVTISNTIDLLTPSNTTTISKINTNGNLITLDNDNPNAIVDANSDRYIQMTGNAANNTEGLEWKIQPNASSISYTFPIGTENEDYTGFTLDFSSTPNNANEFIKAQFEERADPGGFGPTSGFNNKPYFSHIVNCTTGTQSGQEQWIELSSMIQEFGVWDISPNSSSGWEYDITIESGASPTASQNSNSADFQENDPVTGAPYVFHKLIKTNSTISSTYKWNNDVWNSGDICAGHNNIGSLNGLQATNLTSFSKFGVGGNSDTGLPIELLDLFAEGVDNTYIAVRWSTATELNNKGFRVQRRTENSQFKNIGWVDGSGTTNETQRYKYDDRDVEPNTMYFYRLKQIDFNGDFEHTHVVSAMINADNVFAISDFIPNPTTQDSKILVNTSEEKDLQIKLFNTLGQVISDKEITVEPGSSSIDFSLDNVADGTYHAIIAVDNEIFNRKLVITKN